MKYIHIILANPLILWCREKQVLISFDIFYMLIRYFIVITGKGLYVFRLRWF